MNRSESRYFNTAVKMDKALISLLENKDFEYITVSEICKEAGVNRSTFYLHYENTNDLLSEVSKYLIQGFLSYFPGDVSNVSLRLKECSLEELNFITEEYLNPYLSYIKENRRVFLTVLSHGVTFNFEGIYQNMFEHIFNIILDRFHYPEGNRKYVMFFYLNGINAIVIEWLKNDCNKSIEQVSDIIKNCIFGLDDRITNFQK